MKHIRRKFAHCKRQRGESIVQNGLAVTPSDVLRMAERGIPASAQMNTQMIDGHTGSDWNVPLEERRGVDIAQMWQESQNVRTKFRKAHENGQVVNSQTE